MLPECKYRELDGVAAGTHRCSNPSTMHGATVGVDDAFCRDRCGAFFRTGEAPPAPQRRVELAIVGAGQGGPVTTAAPGKVVTCARRGEPTGEIVNCPKCGGGVSLKVFGCSVFDLCTIGRDARALTDWRIKGFCNNGHCPAYIPKVIDAEP